MKQTAGYPESILEGLGRAARRVLRLSAPLGLLTAASLCFVQEGVARTPVPLVITEQGRLLGTDGTPVEGELEFIFALYDSPNSSRSLWLQRNDVVVENGYFSVRLGEEAPFQDALFSEGNLYLGIRIGDDEEMKPRQKITSVPFALRAAYADEAGKAVGELKEQIVPSGAVLAFDLEECPTGWAAFEPARGRTIIGTNPVEPEESAAGTKLSKRLRGQRFGEESHVLTVEQLPPHNHTGTTERGRAMNYRVFYAPGEGYASNRSVGFGSGAYTERTDDRWPLSDHTHAFTTANTGGGEPIDMMPPSVVLLYCRKL